MDQFTDRCSVCHRLAYWSPLTNGVCSHCTPNEDLELCKRMADTLERPEYGYHDREWRRAFRYLWIRLGGL